jgi:hypothetical protein
MLRPSPGENEPQNRMCLLAYHKTMSGLYFMQNLLNIPQEFRGLKDNTTKHETFREGLGVYMI